jgi:hypothetical protein
MIKVISNLKNVTLQICGHAIFSKSTVMSYRVIIITRCLSSGYADTSTVVSKSCQTNEIPYESRWKPSCFCSTAMECFNDTSKVDMETSEWCAETFEVTNKWIQGLCAPRTTGLQQRQANHHELM